jgi:PAS domain S-box-containing protein
MSCFTALDAPVAEGHCHVGVSPSLYEESFYRTLIDHTLDVLVAVDMKGTIEFASPSMQTVLGTSPSTLLGQSLFGLLHADDLAHFQAAFDASMALGADPSLPFVLVRWQHRDRQWRTCETVVRWSEEGGGRRFGVVTLRDVTGRAELEDRCRRSQRLEIVGRMTAALTHDLNNVLTIIGGHSELIEADRSGESVLASAIEIRTAADRATTLTRQLLTFARHGTTSPMKVQRTVDVNGAVAELLAMFDRLVGKRVRLTCRLGSAHPIAAVDRARLDQALINLVINARDAMPDGGRITVTTRDAAPDETDAPRLTGSHLVVDVADTGSGMSPEVRARIFEPFFTTKAAGEGTGLGLATVAEIVEEAGGTIEVDSAEGYGSRFRIRLPYGRPRADVNGNAAAAMAAVA